MGPVSLTYNYRKGQFRTTVLVSVVSLLQYSNNTRSSTYSSILRKVHPKFNENITHNTAHSNDANDSDDILATATIIESRFTTILV